MGIADIADAARRIGRRIAANAGERLGDLRRHRRRRRVVGPSIEDPATVLAIGLVVALFAVSVLDPFLADRLGRASGLVRSALKLLTSFGEGIEILVGSALLVLAALAIDPRGLPLAARAGLVRIGATAAFAFVAVAGSGLTASLFKNAFGRARPDHLTGTGIFELHPFAFRADWASFPSGHATTAGATAAVLALLMPRFARPILIAGALVALTRVALDAHFLSDVIAGGAFGAAFTLALAHALAVRGQVFAHDPDGRLRLAPPKGARWTDVLAALIARARGTDDRAD
jgi:membrane-associated phospholipid phosphatase